MIYPLMPDHASKLYSQIGLSGIENEKWDNAGDFTIKPGQKIGNIEPLFKKLDLPIQDMRLHFYEMFSKFYEGKGRKFEPQVTYVEILS